MDPLHELGLRFLAQPDHDYEDGFRRLAEIELAMHREGATEALMLRRAHAELALGNYLRAAFDAEEIVRGNPQSSEARFLKGQASLGLAAVRMGLARAGIGAYMPHKLLPPTSDLLHMAQQSFASVLARDPEDAQAARALAAAQRLGSLHDAAAAAAAA